MRKVLVATDFSAASARARDYAVALAAPGATLTLVHAHLLPLPDWPQPAYVPDWMPAEPSVREETMERLRLFGAPARAGGLSVDTVTQEGLPADVILAQAEALKPDLIALGTHGRRGFERWLLGSTAERVLRLAPAPVLTVSARGGGPPSRIREVLCAVSLGPGCEQTMSFASDLARRCHSALPLLMSSNTLEGRVPRPAWTARAGRGCRLRWSAACSRPPWSARGAPRRRSCGWRPNVRWTSS